MSDNLSAAIGDVDDIYINDDPDNMSAVDDDQGSAHSMDYEPSVGTFVGLPRQHGSAIQHITALFAVTCGLLVFDGWSLMKSEFVGSNSLLDRYYCVL